MISEIGPILPIMPFFGPFSDILQAVHLKSEYIPSLVLMVCKYINLRFNSKISDNAGFVGEIWALTMNYIWKFNLNLMYFLFYDAQ